MLQSSNQQAEKRYTNDVMCLSKQCLICVQWRDDESEYLLLFGLDILSFDVIRRNKKSMRNEYERKRLMSTVKVLALMTQLLVYSGECLQNISRFKQRRKGSEKWRHRVFIYATVMHKYFDKHIRNKWTNMTKQLVYQRIERNQRIMHLITKLCG